MRPTRFLLAEPLNHTPADAWPAERYEQLVPGATFTVREGPKIVGFGQVLPDKA